jgi:hypothetical protein
MFSVKTSEIPFAASEIAGRVECHTARHATCLENATLRTASEQEIARPLPPFAGETTNLTSSSFDRSEVLGKKLMLI